MKTDKKIVSYRNLKNIRERSRRKKQTLVLTTGCYDILHLGHVVHFHYCKSKGDLLVVSVGNDKCVKMLKGPDRPINQESFRARMIAALECVDYVVISEEYGVMDHNRLVALLKPDVYVVPGTDLRLEEKKNLIESVGGVLVACKRLPPEKLKGGISTTKIVNKLKETGV